MTTQQTQWCEHTGLGEGVPDMVKQNEKMNDFHKKKAFLQKKWSFVHTHTHIEWTARGP